MGRKPQPTEQRFERQYIKTDTCWNWCGAIQTIGYGQLLHNGRKTLAHRYSLERHLGRPIAAGMVCMHSCDNRRCVNPEHLREGTQKENMADMMAKGRHWSFKIKQNNPPPVDEE